ncbi:c-type cytochrome [Bosea thiooxidans]
MSRDGTDRRSTRFPAGSALLGGSVLLLVASGHAAGDPALGAYLASECTACHQLSGRSAGGIPPIIGWPEQQFVAALDAYGRKQRENPVMQTIAARLSREEMAALAAYFGSLKSTP